MWAHLVCHDGINLFWYEFAYDDPVVSIYHEWHDKQASGFYFSHDVPWFLQLNVKIAWVSTSYVACHHDQEIKRAATFLFAPQHQLLYRIAVVELSVNFND